MPVRWLKGGNAAWAAAGFPLSTDAKMADEPLDVWLKPYERAGDPKAAMNEYLSWEVDLLERIERDGTTQFHHADNYCFSAASNFSPNSVSSSALMSLTAQRLRPLSRQRRTLKPCRLSITAARLAGARRRRAEQIDDVDAAAIDDGRHRLGIDVIEPPAQQA